jgi:hypothetical protein
LVRSGAAPLSAVSLGAFASFCPPLLRRVPPSIDDGAIAASSKIERVTAALRGSSRPARS